MATLRFLVLLALSTISSAVYIPPGPKYPCRTGDLETQLLYPCQCLAGSDKGLYVRCENSNLATLAIGLSNLVSLEYPIESLTIASCNISKYKKK